MSGCVEDRSIPRTTVSDVMSAAGGSMSAIWAPSSITPGRCLIQLSISRSSYKSPVRIVVEARPQINVVSAETARETSLCRSKDLRCLKRRAATHADENDANFRRSFVFMHDALHPLICPQDFSGATGDVFQAAARWPLRRQIAGGAARGDSTDDPCRSRIDARRLVAAGDQQESYGVMTGIVSEKCECRCSRKGLIRPPVVASHKPNHAAAQNLDARTRASGHCGRHQPWSRAAVAPSLLAPAFDPKTGKM